ncbi:MAG: serine hydrolase, partial [Thermomicrobiales bacterium]
MSIVKHHPHSSALDRRRVLQLGGAGIGLAALSRQSAVAKTEATPVALRAVPVTGEAVSELDAFDKLMIELMEKWNLPGGQLVIARDSRLVYNRGFGYASVEDNEVVEPEMTFRIASTSKPFTTVAILQ